MPDWFDGGGAGSPVDVAALLDSTAPALFAELTSLGALVSLGTTRDGGAFGVTVTLDGRWRRQYFRDSEELCSWLSEAVQAVSSTNGHSSASAVQGQRPRRRKGL